MADRLPEGFVDNRAIAAAAAIDAGKLKHLFKGERFLDIDVLGKSRTFQIGTRAKVGGTAGWVVGAADNLPYVATMAASQAASTLVIPIDGLNIGDVITGFKLIAQVESAGNAVTIDAALRATTNVAGEPTDAIVGTGMTQVSVTADTAVAQAKTGLTEIVTSGKTYYLLITATTLALTDIILQACEITVREGLVTRTIPLFVADKIGTLSDVAAALAESGSSTSISIDIQKQATAATMLDSPIALVHGTGDLTEVEGQIAGTGAYAVGDVIVAVVTVTLAVGAMGLWIRWRRLESGD